MASVDFAELRSEVDIVQVLDMLGVPVRPEGEQLRGCCPICKSGSDRGFVVTPAKGLWFCFGKCGGGDLSGRRRGLAA
jgi:DNA primase